MREIHFGRRKVEKQFSKFDAYTRKRIDAAIEEIRNNPEIGTSLTGDLAGYLKYRFGKYRIVYSFTDEKVMIVAMDLRNDVYDELKRYIEEIGKMQAELTDD